MTIKKPLLSSKNSNFGGNNQFNSYSSFSAKLTHLFRNDDYHLSLLLLLIIGFFIIFAGLGLRSPWPADEPRFAEVAREMVQSGNWFFPMRGGELYPDKPPVFMWSIALFYWLTGSMKLSFLLPNAIVSLITLVCCYDISARLWNVRTAKIVGLLLLITPQFIIQAKSAQIDAMVAAWITISMYGLIRHFFIQTNWTWYCISWAFMGLGIITKGVGFLPIFFLLPILFFHFFNFDVENKKITRASNSNQIKQSQWKLLLGPICMLLVVACWLVPMLTLANLSHNPDFIAYKDNILFKQTGERYANSWTHIKPWYYFFLTVIPTLWFPLYFVLFNPTFWKEVRQSKLLISLLTWVLLVVIFFSFSPGKRGVYILPALPMMALIAGYFLSKHNWQPYIEKSLKLFTGLLAYVFLVAAVAVFFVPSFNELIGEHELLAALLFFLSGLVWGVAYLKGKRQYALIPLGVALSVTWVLYSFIGYAVVNPSNTPAKNMMVDVQKMIGPDSELGLTRFKEQFLLFSPMSLTHFSYLAEKSEQDKNAWLWMKEKPNRYIFTTDDENMQCFDRSKAISMGKAHRRNWILLAQDALLDTCEAPKVIKTYHLKITKPIT